MSKVTFGSNILNNGCTQTLNDRCLITRDPVPKFSKAGIALPQGHSQPDLVTGVIESVGPDVIDLKAGDEVLYERLAALHMMLQGFNYDVVREDNICAKVYKNISISRNRKRLSKLKSKRLAKPLCQSMAGKKTNHTI